MISRIAKSVAALDGLTFIATGIAGIGILGYVIVSWFMHFVGQGHYVLAAFLCMFVLISVALAFARIPAAVITLLGGAVICGISFVLGYGNVLLP